MVVLRLVRSWILPVAMTLVVAALVGFASVAKGSNHLLSEREKQSILASYAFFKPPCWYIGSYNCASMSGSGGPLTGCGQGSGAFCSGSCTNSCNLQTNTSWACVEGNGNGPYGACPTFTAGAGTCGFQTNNSNCVSVNNVCLCSGGNNTTTACGNTQAEPTKYPGPCP